MMMKFPRPTRRLRRAGVLALIASAAFGLTQVTAAPDESQLVADLAGTHLRVARPTDDLAAITRFYRDALGFEVLYTFEDHDGFDGVMLGHTGAGYHLEFTHHRHHEVGRAPTDDNLLVFYLPDTARWQGMIDRLAAAGHEAVKPYNPYWERRAKTFTDPDGYRIVLANANWGS